MSTSTALTPIEKKRLAALKGMTPSGQALAKQIEARRIDEAKGRILTKYIQGSLVRQAVEEPNEAKYGGKYVTQLSAYLGYGERTLYSLVNFAKAFTEDFVKTHSKRLMSTGDTMELDHWMALMRENDPQRQLDYLDKTFKNSWSANTLAEEINSRNTTARSPRGPGRRPKVASSPIGGLRQLHRVTHQLTKLRESVAKSVFDPVELLSDSQVSSNLLDKLEVTKKSAEEAKDMVDDTITRLDHSIDRVTKLLETVPKSEEGDDGKADVKKVGSNGVAHKKPAPKAVAPKAVQKAPARVAHRKKAVAV